MTKRFLYWWLMFAVQLALVLTVLLEFNGFEYMLNSDVTYISFVVLVLWALTSLSIGRITYKYGQPTETMWFTAESCMTLGMIGTVLGFMFMLSTSFTNIDPSNAEAMKDVISAMAQGMGTALLTTFVGLVASLSLKVQMILVEAF